MSLVKNYMEILVEEYLNEMLTKKTNASIEAVKNSPNMIADIMAESLNHIPPFYVTCKTGEVYGFSNGAISQNKADIMIEIAKAIEVVASKGYNN